MNIQFSKRRSLLDYMNIMDIRTIVFQRRGSHRSILFSCFIEKVFRGDSVLN